QYRDSRVVLHPFPNCVADQVGVRRRSPRLLGDWRAILLSEGGRRVEKDRILGGWLEPMAFFGDDVEQDRPLQVLHHLQVLAEERNVVAVDRTQVAEAQFLEHHAAVQPRFDALFELRQEPLDRIAEEWHTL